MTHSRLRYWPLLLACGLTIALAVWARPRRIETLATLDGEHRWRADPAAPARQFAWQPGETVADLLPPHDPPDEVSHPALADDGRTLFFTVRRSDGDADIYRSLWSDGDWQPATAVTELNTPWDEEGVAVSGDGRQLYLASNRRGGQGGFDLYVSQRRGAGWGVPKNLGDAINTQANEFDPTLATDGLLLSFASDRAGKQQTRDLYFSHRAAPNGKWPDAMPIAGANTTLDERSPCLADEGRLLYFASNRDSTAAENNFNLYRLRLSDPAATVESLGRGINTSANETDPAVSADGFAITFARQEPGAAASLHRSALGEVERIAVWDTSRWQALRAVWRQALLATVVLGGLLAAVYYLGGWLRRRASMARFVAASLLLHFVVLWLMILVPLSQEIVRRVEEIRVSDSAMNLFDDNLHQSHSPGEQAYEKVADLKSVEAVQAPQVARQVIAPTNVPLHADSPAPTLPLELARRLPADRVTFVPPPMPAATQNRELPRSAEAALRVAQLEPLEAEPPLKVAMPEEQPLDQQVEVARAASDHMAVRESPVEDAPLSELVVESVPLEAVRMTPIAAAREAMPARDNGQLPNVAQLDPEAIALASIEKMPESLVLQRGQGELTVAPREASLAKPSNEEPASAAMPVTIASLPIHRQLSLPTLATPSKVEIERLATLPREIAGLSDDVSPDLAKVDAAAPSDLATTEIELPPAAATMLKLNNDSMEAGGPRQAGKMELVVGTLAHKLIDAPPSTNPLATQLQRAAARATPVAFAEDNVGMQAMFALRQGDTRREFIDLVGGNEQTEAAVKRGLTWLVEHQHADGRWSLHQLDPPEKKLPATSGAGGVASDAAATGLGLLPFLGGGHTHLAGDHQAVVGRAVQWLVGRQKPDGNLFADAPSTAFMYSHGIAAIALCEAYGLSQDERLRDPAQRALNFIVTAQHPGTGGWRYQPGEPGDTSVVGWQVMALKSGEMAGLAVPKAALDLANKWLDSAAGTQGALGTFGYQGPGGGPAMTAEGLLCRQFLGARRNDPAVTAGAKYLLQRLPQAGQETSYYWYYATQVMYHMQGEYWTAWNERLRELLVSSQIKDGHQSGTWDPRDNWEQSGGRLYATSLRLLMLEVYYRHLPLYQQLE
jgi:hypothetical protein